ncbi:MAG: acyl-CoA reductase [Flavobacteriaceae bacterium]
MDHKTNTIKALSELGHFLSQFTTKSIEKNESVLFNDLFFDGFKHQIKLSEEHNGWFSEKNILFALESWAKLLTTEKLTNWITNYPIENVSQKKIAIIMAGNIPMVGFHDFLCALICNHEIIVKQSSNDKHLLPFLTLYLTKVAPELKGRVVFLEQKLEGFDAVIATGSDNTARYFEYYFKDKPSIIRKNRNSLAILTGDETKEDLLKLSNDIFQYYGLGCRSVSKLFVPNDYNFDAFFEAMYHWNPIINGAKYANNYDYNKAVYLMSEFKMLENGFLMIKEDESYASPIATLFYEHYDSLESLSEKLNQDSSKIQCIVSNQLSDEHLPFGSTQTPKLEDYADGVDTVDFLLKI